MIYQIFKSLVDIDVNDLFTLSSGITRGYELKLYKHSSFSFSQGNFFFYHVLNPQNNLPQYIIESRSLENFKTSPLDRYDVFFV